MSVSAPPDRDSETPPHDIRNWPTSRFQRLSAGDGRPVVVVALVVPALFFQEPASDPG